MNKNAEVRDVLLKVISVYHTGAMRRDFVNSFGSVCNVKISVLREDYKKFTVDSSVEDKAIGKDIRSLG